METVTSCSELITSQCWLILWLSLREINTKGKRNSSGRRWRASSKCVTSSSGQTSLFFPSGLVSRDNQQKERRIHLKDDQRRRKCATPSSSFSFSFRTRVMIRNKSVSSQGERERKRHTYFTHSLQGLVFCSSLHLFLASPPTLSSSLPSNDPTNGKRKRKKEAWVD